jgi:outer membrane protein assembly factor BamB
MNKRTKHIALAAISAVAVSPLVARAGDWPVWGGDFTRNMVSSETGILTSFDAGNYKNNSEEIDMATTKNVKWVAKLGSQSYGNPTVAKGKVFVGTNNESPRDPRVKGDRGIVYCLDEKTGELVWQLAVPKLGTGKVSDWEYLGICSSPAVDGDKVYLVTNRCEVVCLDINGMANGNDGPYKDEGKYLAGPGKPPIETTNKDADILWRFDMREELGVFPHNITNCGALIFGDKVVVTTSNGVDWGHTNIPNPKAPALVMLNKNTGELLGEEGTPVSSRTLHSNWSSPAFGKVGDKEMIVFGGGDGWAYGLSTETEKSADGRDVLKEFWRFDCNPPEYRMKDGKPLKYATYEGPSEVIATPVFYKNRVYTAIGQDPEHGEGLGQFVCIDATKTGDISKTGALWTYKKIRRSLSTASISNGLVFVGEAYWVYETKSHIWGSGLVVEGKLYVGTEDGDLVILAADKKLKEIAKVDMKAPVYSSPVAANGTLYVATQTHLYAIDDTKAASAGRKTLAAYRTPKKRVAKPAALRSFCGACNVKSADKSAGSKKQTVKKPQATERITRR